MAASESTKRTVWTMSGGRCARCKDQLVDLSTDPTPIGDVAHAAAHSDGPGAPRAVPAMPQEERDHADNLLLLCPSCHRLMDTETGTEVYPLDQVLEMKRSHEEAVQALLDLFDSHETLVFRVLARVKGNVVQAARKEVAAATTARGRVPAYRPGAWGRDAEVDLTTLDESDPGYWRTTAATIAREARTAHDAVRRGDIDHVTVFAFAPLPLLVALGWYLDDTTRADVVQRSRTNLWMPTSGAPATFTHDVQPGRGRDRAVLVVAASGTPDTSAFPQDLDGATTVTVAAASGGGVNVADREANKSAFSATLRTALYELEEHVDKPSTLHVLAATPISMSVEIGRALDPQVFDEVHVYDHTTDGNYRDVLTLPIEETPR